MRLCFIILLFLSSNCFASLPLEGVRIVKTTIDPSKVASLNAKKGDFEGNGGDSFRLFYAMIYNYLRDLKISKIEQVIPPSSIYSFNSIVSSKVIYISNNEIFVPAGLYFNKRETRDVVMSLLRAQLLSLDGFDYKSGNELITGPALGIDSAIDRSGFYDLNQRLKSVLVDLGHFLKATSLRNTLAMNSLYLLNVNLVDEEVYENSGTLVCGIHVKNFEIRINTLCWGKMSVYEQRLLLAHEVFRVLNFKDDDYTYTYQFSKFKKYSIPNDRLGYSLDEF